MVICAASPGSHHFTLPGVTSPPSQITGEGVQQKGRGSMCSQVRVTSVQLGNKDHWLEGWSYCKPAKVGEYIIPDKGIISFWFLLLCSCFMAFACYMALETAWPMTMQIPTCNGLPLGTQAKVARCWTGLCIYGTKLWAMALILGLFRYHVQTRFLPSQSLYPSIFLGYDTKTINNKSKRKANGTTSN